MFRSWGNYPKFKIYNAYYLHDYSNLKTWLKKKRNIICYGNGRSYGDSCLAENVIVTKPYDFFVRFDKNKGFLEANAGVMLKDILETIVPNGWFLPVTPGTKFVTLGGAIASDVHGKNHHIDGSFSEWIEWLDLMLPDGSINRVYKNDELFKATCGGMGLTGVILSSRIKLKKIQSSIIDEIIIKVENLREMFDVFEKYSTYPYSVAWIDCLSESKHLGRGLVMIGRFMNNGILKYEQKKRKNIPLNLPSFFLNSISVSIFNEVYYNRFLDKIIHNTVSIDEFFYPLDAINNWNRIYGKGGFLQYQFIIPKHYGYDGVSEILRLISKTKKGSFLAVLKLYGKANKNYLTFPLEGYSLALDFKYERGILEFLDKLDEIVVKYHGRIYLAKDARMKREVFEKGYPYVEEFRKIRRFYGMINTFNSYQSIRLGI
ncbi:FAD-binding oxidoreductase [Hippea jasoniae]|uniref:FAD-binding oxidoreductase n=1 Tax=Hippea jasoniae TaxID=944479 RepID=UPI0005542107|nr:FAD-binding oxidoreductase [Hippea jasoniae]